MLILLTSCSVNRFDIGFAIGSTINEAGDGLYWSPKVLMEVIRLSRLAIFLTRPVSDDFVILWRSIPTEYNSKNVKKKYWELVSLRHS